MRKRILAMALSICMAVVVCGCGNKKEADETQTGKTDVTVTGEDTVPSGDMAEEDYEMQVELCRNLQPIWRQQIANPAFMMTICNARIQKTGTQMNIPTQRKIHG